MVGGLIALVVVLAAASAAGFVLRKRQGRFHQRTGHDPPSSADALSAADLGAPLGARATLVQFSTEVCAYCGPTRDCLPRWRGNGTASRSSRSMPRSGWT